MGTEGEESQHPLSGTHTQSCQQCMTRQVTGPIDAGDCIGAVAAKVIILSLLLLWVYLPRSEISEAPYCACTGMG